MDSVGEELYEDMTGIYVIIFVCVTRNRSIGNTRERRMTINA